MSLLYGSTFWGYRKGSRVNSNYEFAGIKHIKCYLPRKICLRCNNGNWRSEVHDPQSTRCHEKILQPTKNSGSSVQTWWQDLPGCIGHPNYTPFTETLASMAGPLCSGKTDWTYGLLLKAATLDEATLSSVQHNKAYSGSRWPDYRLENGGPPTTHSYWQRSRVGSKRDTQQSLALEKIPVPHQVERIWLWTQFLGVSLQSLCSRTDSRVLSQTPWCSETHLVHRVWQHFLF